MPCQTRPKYYFLHKSQYPQNFGEQCHPQGFGKKFPVSMVMYMSLEYPDADIEQKISEMKEKYMGLLFVGRFLEGKPYEATMRRQ